MALFGLASALRLPWRLSAWRVVAGVSPSGCLLGGSLPRRCLSRRVSCDCLGAAWSSERLAFALAPVCLAELWREFSLAGACLGGCPAIALALFGLASALRLPWHLSAWRVVAGVSPSGCLLGGSLPRRCLSRRVSCDCLGAAWSSERLAFALAPVCLAELWREFSLAGACLGGCPARALALLGLASALRLPWRLSAWRSCEVLACDSDLVRQGRGLPYKTGSVKDWFGKTRFSRTNWIRKRISLAQ